MQPDPSIGADDPPSSDALRRLGWTLALAGIGLLGALPIDPPGPRQGPDPLLALVWAALAAPVAGSCAARLGLRPWPHGFAAPAVWVLALLWSSSASPRLVPTPLWGALAWMGWFALGAAFTVAAGAHGARAPYVVTLATLALNSAAWAAGLLGAPWPPGVASRLLDASPVAYVVECSGIDWMRHGFIYDSVQTDRFERQAWHGALAGPACLLVGYALWAGIDFAARRRRAARA